MKKGLRQKSILGKQNNNKRKVKAKRQKGDTPRRGIGRENTRPYNLKKADDVLNPGLLRDREGF